MIWFLQRDILITVRLDFYFYFSSFVSKQNTQEISLKVTNFFVFNCASVQVFNQNESKAKISNWNKSSFNNRVNSIENIKLKNTRNLFIYIYISVFIDCLKNISKN